MDQSLAREAIFAALSGEWKKALVINLALIRKNPKDTDALNRAARAYLELGKVKKALQTCQRVLEIDPCNSIAIKCSEKWRILKPTNSPISTNNSKQSFLEEPGKTKIVSLINLGDKETIVKLDAGDVVKIVPRPHRVCITNTEGKYIGRIPDDLSARLKKLIEQGNEYLALVKSAKKNEVKIFLKEVKKSKNTQYIQSFPVEKVEYVAFTSSQTVYSQQIDSDALEEEE